MCSDDEYTLMMCILKQYCLSYAYKLLIDQEEHAATSWSMWTNALATRDLLYKQGLDYYECSEARRELLPTVARPAASSPYLSALAGTLVGVGVRGWPSATSHQYSLRLTLGRVMVSLTDLHVYLQSPLSIFENKIVSVNTKAQSCYTECMNTIYKAAGIIIKDKKLLVERSHGKEFFCTRRQA